MTMSSKSSTGKTCCILIGSAGCGKSTLVESMSSDGTKRSGDSENSVTKSLEVVKHKTNSNLLLMDTIGCEDTDNVMTDDEILKEITHKLAESGAPKIKVIWCTSPEPRKTPKLQKQAKFINSLVCGDWSAVQVIIKKGCDEDASNGVMGAVKTHSNGSVPVLNLHCLDRIKNIQKNFMYKYILKQSLGVRKQGGFLFTKEINGVISEKISSLNSVKAKLKKEYYHKKNGKLKMKMKHDGRIVNYWQHPGPLIQYVSSSRVVCPYGHPESEIEYCVYRSGSWVSYWECDDCGANIRVKDNFYHCFGCCNRGKRKKHSSIVKKCAGMYCTSCGKETRETKSLKYNCCNGSSSPTGCRVAYTSWTCCNGGKSAPGCKEDYQYWDCCNFKKDKKLDKKCGKWKWVPQN